MRKTRVHKVVVRLVFDRPCTRKHAVHEAKDNIHGVFYCQDWSDDRPKLPETFKVRGINSAKGQ